MVNSSNYIEFSFYQMNGTVDAKKETNGTEAVRLGNVQQQKIHCEEVLHVVLYCRTVHLHFTS